MAQITLNSTGVASSGSLVLQSNGTTSALTIDTAQNVGLGVTPSAWGSPFKALQIGTTGNFFASNGGNTSVTYNAYYNGTNYIYQTSDYATRYSTSSSGHLWFTAASGTAGGTVSFTQAMTLDASGKLGIGVTSPSQYLSVSGSDGSNNVASFTRSGGATMYTYVDTGNNVGFFTGSNAAGGGFYANSSDSSARIMAGSAERARIDSSGNLLVGTTSTSVTSGGVTFQPAAGQSYGDWGHVNGTSSGSYYLALRYNGTIIGGITQNGTTAVAYNTTSDYRLKENVQPLTGALARVSALKPCTYTWKAAPDEIGEGFIAHELAEVCPQAVTGEKDAVNEDGSIKAQSIDTSFLVATLTAAIQELNAKVVALEAKVK